MVKLHATSAKRLRTIMAIAKVRGIDTFDKEKVILVAKSLGYLELERYPKDMRKLKARMIQVLRNTK